MNPRVMRAVVGTIALSVLLLATNSTRSQGQPGETSRALPRHRDALALERLRSPPLGLPSVPVPDTKRPTIEMIALGRKLFFDRRLSSNDTMSCGMCHIPEQGFTNNELSTPIGVHGRSLKRNAPTILNVAYAETVFLDGRATSLETQVPGPLLAHDEMANPTAESLVAKIAGLSDYQGLFEEAFGDGPSVDRIASAIASWERTLLAADSPFDRWRYGLEADGLTRKQQRGFELFVGRARCAQCHLVGSEHALFADQKFHDTGVGFLRDRVASHHNASVRVEIAPQIVVSVDRQLIQQVGQVRPSDKGRFEVTKDPEDMWRFKTPSLRNVAVTAPYMHDGSLPTLEAVVSFYNRGGAPHRGLDPLIKPLGLDDHEISAIVAFLHSLTADNLDVLQADARSTAVGN